MRRLGFGINGLDSMIAGGIPSGAIVGLMGPPGVGKSIVTLHFLLEGARKGDKCVYINLEEPAENIMRMIEQFDFSKEFFKYIDEGRIVIKCFTYEEYDKMYYDIFQKLSEDKTIQRLAIDSFNCFFASYKMFNVQSDEVNYDRKSVNKAFALIRKNKLTTIMTLESQDNTMLTYNIPYMVDGIIKLDFLELGVIERRVFIPKMRWTNQFKESRSYEISSAGIDVEIEEE
jgi:KaiC/GvpD/RAD55 family RecA-like ATPase